MLAKEIDPAFEKLLEYLKNNRGFDFTEYKRASLVRRVNKRMNEVGIEEYEEYQDYLEVHPQEFTELFNTILINVTSFLRDPEAWGRGDPPPYPGGQDPHLHHPHVERRLRLGRGGLLAGHPDG